MTQAAAPICLLTRPQEEALRFAEVLRARYGLSSVISPLLRIKSLPLPHDLSGYRAAILTSAQAARRLPELGLPPGTPCFAVGKKTALAARDAGYVARAVGGDAAGLIAALIAEKPTGPLIHLRGEHARGDIANTLSKGGVDCQEAVVYQQLECDLTPEAEATLKGDIPVILPLFSPRTALLFFGKGLPTTLCHAAFLSPVVAEIFAECPLAGQAVAKAPTEGAICKAIETLTPVRALLESRGMQG